MTKVPDGGTAFPVSYPVNCRGMTLRDWFAGMALQGAIAGDESKFQVICGSAGRMKMEIPQFVAGLSYQIADAMLEERGK